jgi:neutral ceramidase
MARARALFVALVVALAFPLGAACSSTLPMTGADTTPPRYLPRAARPIEVGAARADITPPPGASTFGHAPDSRVSQGYWSRLYCRAFVFVPAGDTPLAMVSCDLGAISTLLQRSVAALVRPLGIHPSRVLLSATHTHAGPAHFFDGSSYGGSMSTRMPGFDPAMLRFLATRIADAINEAHQRRAPAALGWGRAYVFHLTHNRSLGPFRANQPLFDLPGAEIAAADPNLTDEERAIDPVLRVLRIDEVDPADPSRARGPIGAIGFFAMHPTVLSSQNRLFGADVDGVVSRALEREMRRDSGDPTRDPLFALVNTNEGDISPNWIAGTIDEANQLGSRLAAHAHGAYERAGESRDPSPIIDARYAEPRLPGARLGDGTRLCDRPELGASTVGGATDHPTSFAFIDDVRPGNVDLTRRDCHAPRRKFAGLVQDVLVPHGSLPDRAPIALVQLGSTAVAFLPAEATITAGGRIAASVLATMKHAPDAPTDAVIAGLANGYIQYVATEEEYQLQHYEGASTLYGPRTQAFFTEWFARLAQAMLPQRAGSPVAPSAEPIGVLEPFGYKTGPHRKRLADGSGEPDLLALGQTRGPYALCELRGVGDAPPAYCFVWHDGAPGIVPLTSGPWVELLDARTGAPVRPCGAPLFARETGGRCDPQATIDDRGLAFRTMAHRKDGDAWIWSTLFSPPRGDYRELAERRMSVRLRVRGDRMAHHVLSAPFGPDHRPPACSAYFARMCGVR